MVICVNLSTIFQQRGIADTESHGIKLYKNSDIDFCKQCNRGCTTKMKEQIFDQVKTAAYHLIEKKGATYHAIGLATLTIVESIVRNQNTVLTISTYLEQYLGISDVCLSVPTILNRAGAASQIELPLTGRELKKLIRSAEVINNAMQQAGLK